MKIATHNRLAHYQVEFQELQEQTNMLNGQLPGLQSQIVHLQGYLSANQGDRQARSQLVELQRRANAISSSIRRNMTRMGTLQRQIQGEYNKAMYGRTGTRRSSYGWSNGPRYY